MNSTDELKETERFLSFEQVAKVIGRTPIAVRRLYEKRKLAGTRCFDRRIVFSINEVERFVAQNYGRIS